MQRRRGRSKAASNGPLFIVERIIDRRRHPDGRLQFLIKWKDYDSTHNTWEYSSNVAHCKEIIDEFKEYRAANGYVDSEDDEPPPPKKRGRRRTTASAHRTVATDDVVLATPAASSAVVVHQEPSASSNFVNFSNANRVMYATFNERGKYFLVVFDDGSKMWVANGDCRRHIPHLLLDYYEQKTVFVHDQTEHDEDPGPTEITIEGEPDPAHFIEQPLYSAFTPGGTEYVANDPSGYENGFTITYDPSLDPSTAVTSSSMIEMIAADGGSVMTAPVIINGITADRQLQSSTTTTGSDGTSATSTPTSPLSATGYSTPSSSSASIYVNGHGLQQQHYPLQHQQIVYHHIPSGHHHHHHLQHHQAEGAGGSGQPSASNVVVVAAAAGGGAQ